jgi:hypothetical protein
VRSIVVVRAAGIAWLGDRAGQPSLAPKAESVNLTSTYVSSADVDP